MDLYPQGSGLVWGRLEDGWETNLSQEKRVIHPSYSSRSILKRLENRGL